MRTVHRDDRYGFAVGLVGISILLFIDDFARSARLGVHR